jgi:hypothetical protein
VEIPKRSPRQGGARRNAESSEGIALRTLNRRAFQIVGSTLCQHKAIDCGEAFQNTPQLYFSMTPQAIEREFPDGSVCSRPRLRESR